MEGKITRFVWSCLTVLLVFLVSSAAAASPQKEAGETVQWKGRTVDGIVVEKHFEKPRYGGVLNLARSTSPQFHDQARGHRGHINYYTLVCDELVRYDWAKGPTGTGDASWMLSTCPVVDKGLHGGGLAEDWEMPDAETLVFRIRKGVRFHNKPPVNGRELTADDCLATAKYYWETPGCWHHTAYPWDTHLESITAPDKYKLVVKVKPDKMGQVFPILALWACIIPRDAITHFRYEGLNDWRNIIGSGPFILADYVPDSVLSFARNPEYWQDDPFFPENRLPYVDGIKQFIIPDLSTRLAALRTAKIDQIMSVTWDDAKGLMERNPELKHAPTVDSPPAAAMRCDQPPFNDARVRRALMMAFNHREVLETFYSGKGVLISWPVAPIPENKGLFVPFEDLPQGVREIWEYHPEKAKQLLAEAGYPNGLRASLICYAAQVEQAELIAASLAKVGVEIEIDVKEYGVYTKYWYKRNYPHMLMTAIPGTMVGRFVYTAPWMTSNYSLIDDTVFNGMIKECMAFYFDRERFIPAYKKTVPYQLGQAWYLHFPTPYIYAFWQPWLKGYSGEGYIGYQDSNGFARYIWVDQDLKAKTTGAR